jgi:hypothetical protein
MRAAIEPMLLEQDYLETINSVASSGFIGLATDRASFRDFRDFIAPFDGVEAHSTRIPFVEVFPGHRGLAPNYCKGLVVLEYEYL